MLSRAALFFSIGVALVVSCTPQQARDLTRSTPAIVDASCVLLRALTDDGTTKEICATADELAPFLSELLSAHKAEEDKPVTFMVAAALPAPKRKPPRRRCVEWRYLGTEDGGKGGDDGGRGIDASLRDAESPTR